MLGEIAGERRVIERENDPPKTMREKVRGDRFGRRIRDIPTAKRRKRRTAERHPDKRFVPSVRFTDRNVGDPAARWSCGESERCRCKRVVRC